MVQITAARIVYRSRLSSFKLLHLCVRLTLSHMVLLFRVVSS